MYRLQDYDFFLPEDRIAQHPKEPRDQSRLLVLNRATGAVRHHRFDGIGQFLLPGDVLVVNDTRVVPGRLLGRKATGGVVEVLVLDYADALRCARPGEAVCCRCLVRSARSPKAGADLFFDGGLRGRIEENRDGVFRISFFSEKDFGDCIEQIGSVPLPPYIRRAGKAVAEDRTRYQTVYAAQKGAAAAPTAGLHFTDRLLTDLRSSDVRIAAITLHVGYGTFRPVKEDDIRKHPMHSESYTISSDTAAVVNGARAQGRRVVAVGTTCVRTLEYAADSRGRISAGSGQCDLFIYPGYAFRAVDAMITNFHLPRSTLLMLVSAFAGREKVLAAYGEAVANDYRFFSYGDAMMVA